jgi:hypothetical protein
VNIDIIYRGKYLVTGKFVLCSYEIIVEMPSVAGAVVVNGIIYDFIPLFIGVDVFLKEYNPLTDHNTII